MKGDNTTRFSRRRLGAVLTAFPLLQAQPPQTQAETEAKQAVQTFEEQARELARVKVERSVEPSFRFEA
jgi:hypothetical protein